MSKKQETKSAAPRQAGFLGKLLAVLPLFPVLAVVCIVPLVTHFYKYNPHFQEFLWFSNTTEAYDVFLYYKGLVLRIIAVIMAVYMAVDIVRNRGKENDSYAAKDTQTGKLPAIFKTNPWLIPLIAFAILAFLSTLVSGYRSFGFSGIYEQHESIWVVLSYCMVCVYTWYVVRQQEDLGWIAGAFAILMIILIALGIPQLLGKDFFETDLGRRLILGDLYKEAKDRLMFNFSGSGNHQVFMTLYNPNYVGMFANLALPVLLSLVLASKKIWQKLFWAAASLGMFVCVLGSGSRTFLFGFAFCLVVAVFFYRKWLLRHIYVPILAVVLFIGAGAYYFHSINVNFVSYVKNALQPAPDNYILSDIVLHDDHIELDYNGAVLNISYNVVTEDGGTGVIYHFWDGNGKDVNYQVSPEGVVTLPDAPVYDPMKFQTYMTTSGSYYVNVNQAPPDAWIDGIVWNFTKTDDGYKIFTKGGKTDDIHVAPYIGFENRNHFATNRGYIWSRTLPVMLKHALLGTGQDTFVIYFPQDDYVTQYNAGFSQQLITKPHNMYLQIGTQNGIPALLCFLAVALIYLLSSAKLYWKRDVNDPIVITGIGLALGVVGYLFSGMLNDSMVVVAPLYWLMIGLGLAVNRIVRTKA